MGETARVWLISGVGSGLGEALARAALDRGDKVCGIVRRVPTAGPFVGSRGEALAIVADVASESGMIAAVARCEAELGPIDILVNNAGQVLETTVEEADLGAVASLMGVNLLGPIALIKAVLPSMRARHRGHIVNISSGGGFVGLAALGPYCASKFALEGLSEALAQEVGPLGIKVTIVEPGSFRTNLLAVNTHRIDTSIDDYRRTCGPWRQQLAAMSGAEPNDPKRFADAMLALVDLPSPPLRLPLGDDAIGMVEGKLAAIAQDIAPVRALGSGLGFSSS